LNGGFDWRRCVLYPATCGADERIVDLDWNPNSEADVIGYYVYRVTGTGADWNSPPAGDTADVRVACVGKASTTTSPGPNDFLEPFQPACWDTGIAQQSILGSTTGLINYTGASAQYWIRAIDPDPSNPSQPRSETAATNPLNNHSGIFTATENMLNLRPLPPALTVTNQNGSPCLSWTDSVDYNALHVLQPNPVRFYRIYRNGSPLVSFTATIDQGGGVSSSATVYDFPYSDRIARSATKLSPACDGSGNFSYLDVAAGSSNWNYWVTAVDQNYLESFSSNLGSWTAP
jgi:hypothetical protein